VDQGGYMSYLARLKALEAKKNIINTHRIEPPKPPKVSFDPFAGSYLRSNKNIYAITDTTIKQKEELKLLVLLVSNHHGFSQEDTDEALYHALEDPILALTCFTELARQAGLIKC
jgi:hypothetical protein